MHGSLELHVMELLSAELLFQLGREELGDIMQPESRENQVWSVDWCD